MIILASYLIWGAWKKQRDQTAKEKTQRHNLDLPFFDFDAVAIATNNFSCANKLGEGGFGSVYKGELPTGQEIAVKRLSQKSGQGLNELRNEVILVAKLQHRNLVRLLGYCIQKEEKMLIYEYMPNNSLATFLFDQSRSVLLSWEKRFNIVMGIGHGLVYLHTYSRLRVIHRDLKTSNILLDSEMKPKISDFGMAITFGDDQVEDETTTVVGTYGYMSPEYAIDGLFSMKSDVFSFGVLVLELVSGKKNRGFYHPDHNLTLLGLAWELWNASKALELGDELMADSMVESEVLRLIQVGLLCVQQDPKDGPNMSSVVLMLSSESAISLQPKQPVFYNKRCLIERDSSLTDSKFTSLNDISVTLFEAR